MARPILILQCGSLAGTSFSPNHRSTSSTQSIRCCSNYPPFIQPHNPTSLHSSLCKPTRGGGGGRRRRRKELGPSFASDTNTWILGFEG